MQLRAVGHGVTVDGMRMILVLVLMAGCGTEEVAFGDAQQVDPLAARLEHCGAPKEQPIQAPATLTDSHGDTLIVLDPHAWDGYAAYMDASHAWSDCIVYGVAP